MSASDTSEDGQWQAARRDPFGIMSVNGTDQGAGRHYVCPCGWEGWSAWGHARRHAARCTHAWADGVIPDPADFLVTRRGHTGRDAAAP